MQLQITKSVCWPLKIISAILCDACYVFCFAIMYYSHLSQTMAEDYRSQQATLVDFGNGANLLLARRAQVESMTFAQVHGIGAFVCAVGHRGQAFAWPSGNVGKQLSPF